MSEDKGLNPYGAGSPYTDSGTGAYEGPPSEVTYGAEHDPNPTGLVDGPPESVTIESPPEHLSEPSGAQSGPPASVTYGQPLGETEEEGATTKAVKTGDVEDKAVTGARTSTRRR